MRFCWHFSALPYQGQTKSGAIMERDAVAVFYVEYLNVLHVQQNAKNQ
jgi:hypothetical protein